MYILLSIITIDCIISYYLIGILRFGEANPLVALAMETYGVGITLIFKFFSSLVILFLVKYISEKNNINYNSYCRIASILYVAGFFSLLFS